VLDALSNTLSDSIRITVHSRTPTGSPVELANTPIILATSFQSGTEDLTFVISSDGDPSSSSVQLIMDADGGLGYIQWQTHSVDNLLN
jgi:hypothetical protein